MSFLVSVLSVRLLLLETANVHPSFSAELVDDPSLHLQQQSADDIAPQRRRGDQSSKLCTYKNYMKFIFSVKRNDQRIVGGKVVDPPYKYPFQVYFQVLLLNMIFF